MPLNPKDLNEERLMALANSLWRVMRVQEYILDRMPLTDDEPHKKHAQYHEMKRELSRVNDTLHAYFFGD